MSNLIDLTGKHFGRWTVLYRAKNCNGRIMWHCRCECGQEKDVRGDSLKSGLSQSCGCLQKQKASDRMIDLTGQQFTYLTVLYKNGKTKSGIIKWHCKCKCGKETDVDGTSLRSGRTKSCGCIKKISNIGNNFKDLTNHKYGKLLVLYRNGTNQFGSAIWHCKCDCGKEIDVSSPNLIKGFTSSCGCTHIVSKGEAQISKILIENNILFEREKTFPTLLSQKNRHLRFDFFLPKLNTAIEFQGEQHFYPIEIFGGKENFENQQINDHLKEEYCIQNGIKLIKIAYYDFSKIKDILIQEKILN